VFEPLKPDDTLTSYCKIVDVLDKGKGKGAIILSNSYSNRTLLKVSQSRATTSRTSSSPSTSSPPSRCAGRCHQHLQVGAGGFGGPKSNPAQKECVPVPARAPDLVVEQKTSHDAPALYRMSGDLNPLHIDSSFAAIMGSCSLQVAEPDYQASRSRSCTACARSGTRRGTSCRRRWAATSASSRRSRYRGRPDAQAQVRFSKPVLPGQTLLTEMWRSGENAHRVHFQTRVKETGAVVIASAYVDFTRPVEQLSAHAKL